MPVNSFDDYYLSWRPKKEDLTKPYYLSLAKLLEADISSGVLSGGTELPPQRELADYLDLHFTTVTKAYNECRRRNLIYGIAGSGTFVNPHAVKPVTNSMETVVKRSACLQGTTAIEMGFISTFEQANQIVLEHLPQLIDQTVGVNFNYANPTGSERHKSAGLQWMAQVGVHADIDHTAIVTGSMNALAICLLALFGSGGRVVVDQYVNTNFIELSKLFHLQLIPARMDRYGMLPESLEQVCQKYAPTGIYLMPSCNNPTTACIPTKRRLALAEIIRRYDLTVMEDDQYAFALPDPLPSLWQLLPEQTLYICETAHSICSGLRIAYLAYPSRFQDKIYSALVNVNVKVSALDAEVVCRLIESGLADTIAGEKIARAKQAHGIFREIFPENFCAHPHCFFRWLEIPQCGPGDLVEQELLAQGVHVYHSRRFICGKADGTEHLRIALSSARSEEELRDGLRRIKRYVQ